MTISDRIPRSTKGTDRVTAGAAPRRLPFYPALEGMRGVAMIVVLIAHVGLVLVYPYRQWFFPGGAVWLSVFFVLSGFLITALLLVDHERYGRIRYRQFWRGRARRLYPPLLLVLGVHFLLVLSYGRAIGPELRQDVWALTNTINYRYSVTGVGTIANDDIMVLWSVAVEVQFYLVWPLVMGFILRSFKSIYRILAVLVFFALAGTVVRALEYRAWGDWVAVYFRFEGRLDAFALGAVLGFLWYHRRVPVAWFTRLAWPGWALLIVALWATREDNGFLYSWGFLAFNLIAMVLIGACLDERFHISRFLSTRFLRMTGRVSYSFYITHVLVYFFVMIKLGDLGAPIRIALALCGTVVLGAAVYLIGERPFLSRPSLRPKAMSREKLPEKATGG